MDKEKIKKEIAEYSSEAKKNMMNLRIMKKLLIFI